MKRKTKYYSLAKILEIGAHYNLIFGERSNGKTYSVLKYGLEQYVKTGRTFAYIRRWEEDLTGNKGAKVYAALIDNNEIYKITGEWCTVVYRSRAFYLARYDEEDPTKIISSDTPFGYALSVSAAEHYKSIAYPTVSTILFDEFITRKYYLNDEFIEFTNLLSTIIRDRDDVKIFMCGNTVNRYANPYFTEMGLTHAKDMTPGKIDVYTYGESNLRVAVEHTAPTEGGKASDVYFTFNNPKLNMITSGVWEIALYPHCPRQYLPKDVRFTYFILFEKELLQCEVIALDDGVSFTYIHRKTSDLKHPDVDLIYSPDYDPRPNWHRRLVNGKQQEDRILSQYFQNEKVYYQNNEIGEIVNAYIKWCTTTPFVRT